MRLTRRMMATAMGAAALAAGGHAMSAPKLEPLSVATDKGVAHFQVEIADTGDERERGLMFRKSLAANRGMLFIFPQPGFQAFWMKNTLIPLDIIYISSAGRVVSVAERATPLSEESIPSKGPAQFVLELPGGRAAQIGVKPGDRVIHHSIPDHDPVFGD